MFFLLILNQFLVLYFLVVHSGEDFSKTKTDRHVCQLIIGISKKKMNQSVIPKFQFSLPDTGFSIVDTFEDRAQARNVEAIINEELLSFLNNLKTTNIPYIFQNDVWEILMEPIKSKTYPFGELNISKDKDGLKFPQGSVVIDAISILKHYKELFPFHDIDWSGALYEMNTSTWHMIMKLFVELNENETVCLAISFQFPITSNESITYQNFKIEFRYTNNATNKCILVYPFFNTYRSGFINAHDVVTSHSFNDLPSCYENGQLFWNFHNTAHRNGFNPAIIIIKKNKNTGNSVIRFRFVKMGRNCSYGGRPSAISWEQTPTGETLSISYSFYSDGNNINLFPLFMKLYPDNSFIDNFESGNRLKCFSHLAVIFNDDTFQFPLLGLSWLGVKKQIQICIETVNETDNTLKIMKRKGHLEVLSNDIVAFIFSFLFPDVSVGFLTQMIKFNVQKLNKRKNAL